MVEYKSLGSYRHLFFDLDRTLWDYDTNTYQALSEIIDNHGLMPILKNFDNFWVNFNKHNYAVWGLFIQGLINKDNLRVRRFELALNDFGITNPELAFKLNEDYLNLSPKKTNLMDGAIDILSYLKIKKYHLYILTNGFTNIQKTKMKESGIDIFFEQVFTSDKAGYTKPNRRMFEFAVKRVNAKKKESLMIGDDLQIDIQGAINFGMDQVYYNPGKLSHDSHPTYEIYGLSELKLFL